MIEKVDLWRLSAKELAGRIASRDISAVDLLRHYRSRIQQLDPTLNAFVASNPGAEAEAAASDQRHASGAPLSLIDGLPIAVKDNLIVKGMPCTWGSKLFADNFCEHDEIPVERLRALGAVILGKTNVPEFTLEGYTGNPLFGVTNNPWAPSLTPGGSSGGSVAAVAAGLSPLAIGTDGGGSIRRPAAYTGLVGFKPSIGRIARGAGLPQLLLDFEVVGPIARTVSDCRMLYDLLVHSDPRDHLSMKFGSETQRDAKNLRILFVERLGSAPLDSEIESSVQRAAQNLIDLGHQVEAGKLPDELEQVNAFWPMIGEFSLAKLMSDYPGMRETASPKYTAMADAGQNHLAKDFLRGLEAVGAWRNIIGELFQTYDVIMTPTCAAMPWPAGEAYPETIDDEKVGPRGHAIYTGWVNACGHPAISLPSLPTENGMPIGFQLIGGFGQEALLFDLAEQYQQAHPWAKNWPSLVEEQ